jgi:hypothetical protein
MSTNATFDDLRAGVFHSPHEKKVEILWYFTWGSAVGFFLKVVPVATPTSPFFGVMGIPE